MRPGPIQSASTDLDQLVGSAWDFITHFWWVAVIVLVAWYLRWYGKAREADVDNPVANGFNLWLKDVFGTTSRALAIVAIVGVGLLGFLGFVLNLLPVIAGGVGDPLTLGLVATMVAAAGAAFDVSLSTPRNVAIAGVGVFAIMYLVTMFVENYSEAED